jgi:uncharacterized protein (TIGR02611 family)
MPAPGLHSFRELLRFILRTGKRVVVFVLGVALLAGGLVMMVTPGPGLLLIIAGLAILATEFAWAEVMLDRAKVQATKAKDSVWSRIKRRRRAPDQPS